MLTPEGLGRVWEVFVGEAQDSLKGGTIVVSDGQQSAAATIDEFPFVNANEETGEVTLTVSATFPSEQGNFAWVETRVETREGVVVDRTTDGAGSKASGSEWTVTVDLVLTPGA